MDKTVAQKPFKSTFSVMYNSVDLTDCRAHEMYANDKGKKMKLSVYKCTGECYNQHNYNNNQHSRVENMEELCDKKIFNKQTTLYKYNCKLQHCCSPFCNMLSSCPYIYQAYEFIEPRNNTSSHIQWDNMLKLLKWRPIFGDYTLYYLCNENNVVDHELYKELKNIAEFSFEALCEENCSFDEMKEKISSNPQDMPYLTYRYDKSLFLKSLCDQYTQELTNWRDGILCRLLLNEDDRDYLKWKDNRTFPLIRLGNYYMITISSYAWYHTHGNPEVYPSYISLKHNYISIKANFLKESIKFFNTVTCYDENNTRFIIDSIKEILAEPNHFDIDADEKEDATNDEENTSEDEKIDTYYPIQTSYY